MHQRLEPVEDLDNFERRWGGGGGRGSVSADGASSCCWGLFTLNSISHTSSTCLINFAMFRIKA